ncbi:MAG: DNA translocase FtsK [Phycisphaerales bacterium]|nr:DNA translocase FtsK [Phycisphaerales bacterium]
MTKPADAETLARRRSALQIAGLVLLASWLFVLVALVGYSPADPPTHSVYPPNPVAENPLGQAGAGVASLVFKTLGYPAWVLLIGTLFFLVIPVFRVKVTFPILRAVGLVMLVAGLCGVNAVAFPAFSPMPGLAGGLLGDVIGHEMVARFNVLGSMIWLIALVVVGAVVAMDRYLLAAPRAIGAGLAPAAKTAGVRFSALRALRGRLPRRSAKVRIDDLDDAEEPGKGGRIPRARPRAEVQTEPIEVAPEPEASECDEPGEVEPSAHPADAAPEGANEGDDLEDDEDDAPGAPQVFDTEALRAKIAKLPLRFASAGAQSATQEDLEDIQNASELEGYQFPSLELLEEPEANFSQRLEGLVREQAEALEAALQQYRIRGEVVGIESGPAITLYQVKLAPGTRVSALEVVRNDVARALKAVNIRIVSNQAGRDTVGIEVPNPTKEKVRLKELMSNRERFAAMRLPMFLGKDASGEPLIGDLTEMPHMLIAGTTGSGKSVCMNTIIMSFLYTRKPNELKLVLVDPKMVEMSQFKDIPHLMCPVVTEMSKAAAILEWACKKMDERYELLAEAGCRDIASYNALTWDELRSAFNPKTQEEEARIPRKLPYMVFIIDELADLMMTNKEVEGSIIRIAQKARAVGIHLILATQRPQANVVTGLIKSNMPCRISFKVASGMDSRIVLDHKGGELLLGQGDMLFLSPRTSKLSRAQGTLVDDKEIRRVVRFMRDVASPSFERQLIQLRSGVDAEDQERIYESENNSSASLAAAQEDPLFDRAVEIVLETKRGSVSLLQRRLAIGYTRASRLIDLMGIAGIISDHKGSVARDVVITQAEWDAMKALAAEGPAAPPGRQGQLFGDEAEMKPRHVEPPSLDALADETGDADDAADVDGPRGAAQADLATEPSDDFDDGEGEPDTEGFDDDRDGSDDLAPWEEARDERE